MVKIKYRFDWDENKNALNQAKHGVAFEDAQYAFDDPDLVIIDDISHSAEEWRYHALGMVNGDVLTVRFTVREEVIRILGAAYWRKGRKIYGKKKQEKMV